MFAIDHPTASPTLPAPSAPGTPGYFHGGDVGAGQPRTVVPADYMNMLMVEVLNVLVAAGIAPAKTVYNQLVTAIGTLITNALAALVTNLTSRLAFVGEIKWRISTTPPDGWLLANGATIGSAASGAVGRAHADTAALYTLLWNETVNADLPIQDAAGGASTRGGSAAADFAANKRLPLIDLRGVVIRGLDMGRGFGGQTAMGAYLADAFQGHRMSLPGMPKNGTGSSYGGGGAGVQLASNETQTGDPIDNGTNGTPRTAAATRDKSVGLAPLIKL